MYRYVCEKCDGDNVTSDALARWSVFLEAWEISSVLDSKYCEDCDEEVLLKYIIDDNKD